MRTTLDIEEDVLLAAKDIARRRRSSVGRVLSELARSGLVRSEANGERNGIPLFPVRPGAGVATLELVNSLRDDTP
ncbi:MAG: CopG family transcriptional regulator [Chloroflexi bacterium]|nr:CopG family transcriptional regulator [Chloroflexota bacterium]